MANPLLFITFLVGSIGIYLGTRVFKNFIFFTKNDVSLVYVLLNSIAAGVSGVLIFY